MNDRTTSSGQQILASLVAVLLVTTVLGPVGLASAQTVSFTQTVQGGDTTVAPGDTFTVEATIDYSDVNSPAIDATPPSGWTVTSHTDDGGTYGPPKPAWIWLLGDSDGVSGTNTTTYTVQVPSDASPGDYTIEGEGSAKNPADSSDVVANDDLTITVEDTNTAPTADAGADQTVNENTTVTLDASGSSDSDGSIASYSWTQTGGTPSVSLSGASAAQPTFTAPDVSSDQTLTFEVEVTDDDGANATDTVNVTVQDTDGPNTEPTIDAITDTGVSEGGSTTVSVSASDQDTGDSLSLSVSGPGFVSISDNGDGTGTITITPGTDTVGTYTVTVTADDGQASASEEFAVYVDEPDQDGQVVFAVNAGGPEYTTSDGTTYVADTNFDGGTSFSAGSAGTPTNPAIANTDDDTLYQTERYGDPFSYDIPVSESGTYEVTLQFAEFYQGVSSGDSPDSSGPTDGTNENDRLFDASIEGQQVLSEYDIFSEVGPLAASDKTYTVEVTDGTLNVNFSAINDNAKISAIKVEQISQPQTSADVKITPDSDVEASTYSGGSYQVTNTGDTNIQNLTLDLSETMLADMVFDPFNTAGDDVGKEFSLDSGDVTVQNVEYTNFHNGVDNEAGYDTVDVTLSGFEPGETMSFSIDNDPTSIDTTDLGSQAAGPVSGLEITGGTVSIDSGSGPIESTIVGDGSAGGSMATVKQDTDESTPAIGVQGVSLSSTTLSSRHSAATVPSASQTITISGAPANAEVTLLRVEAEMNLNNVPTPYELEEYEANDANNVQYYTATTDSNGEATVGVTLTDNPDTGVNESGLNYFTAWVNETDGDTGPLSDYVILQLNEPPTADAGADQTVNENTTVTLDASGSSDSDGSIASYSWTQTGGTPSVSLSGASAAGPTFTAPDVSANTTLTFEVTVTDDDGSTATDSVNVTVQDTDDEGLPDINGNGMAPTDPDDDGLYEDVNGDGDVNTGDPQALFASLTDSTVQNNTQAFDFNDDGKVNTGDPQALFADILGSGGT